MTSGLVTRNRTSVPAVMNSQRASVLTTTDSATKPSGGVPCASANVTPPQEQHEVEQQPPEEQQPHRHRGDDERATRTVAQRLGGVRLRAPLIDMFAAVCGGGVRFGRRHALSFTPPTGAAAPRSTPPALHNRPRRACAPQWTS